MNVTTLSRTLDVIFATSAKIAVLICGFAAAMAILLAGVFLVILLILIGLDVTSNNGNLRHFAEGFAALPHAPHSSILSEYRFVGGTGNSNHCDFLVGQLRASSLPETQIADFYETLDVTPPNTTMGTWGGSPPRKTPVSVAFLHDEVLTVYPFSDLLERDAPPLPTTENVYVVYAFEDGYPPGADPRCH